MKIGILTFHNAVNYGAILQAFALQNKLCNMGYDAEIIDYRNPCISQGNSSWNLSSLNIKKIIYACIAYRDNKKKIRKFILFRQQRLRLSNQIYNRSNISESVKYYDKFLVGSDQVWNFKLTNNDMTYLLDYCKQNDMKYSYAASMGIEELNDQNKSIFSIQLNYFKKISVREKENAVLLRTIVSRPIEVMIDPVFLLNRNTWNNIAKKPAITHKYILTYKLNDTPDTFAFASLLSKQTGYPVIALQAQYRRISNDFIKRRSDSPEEFIGWIQNAEFVLTDSFHATAFSIIFNKKFMSFLKKGEGQGNSRIINLLRIFNLEDRIGSLKNINLIKQSINYHTVNNIIKDEKDKAETYLNLLWR